MYILAVLCASLHCSGEFRAVEYFHTLEQCRSVAEDVYKDTRLAWVCVEDLQPVGYGDWE